MRRALAILAIGFALIPSFASAAFDTSSSADSSGAVASLTDSHTIGGTCTNTLVITAVNINSNSNLISSVNDNGVGMTQLMMNLAGFQGSNYIYYMLGASTGSNSIVASVVSNTGISIRTSSFCGVAQTGFPDAHTSATSSSAASTFSTSITTITNNAWVYAFATSDHGALSAGTNLTLRTGGSATNIAEFDTNGAITPAGATTLGFSSTSGSSDWNISAVSFAPAAAATPAAAAYFMAFWW